MALNYAKTNTFVTATTISSSAVNANFDDVVNAFTGLENKSKSLSNLLVDTLLQASGVLNAGDGAVGAPALAFVTDTSTGIYRIGTSNIGIATGGTKRFDISATAINCALPVVSAVGAVGTPGLTFTGDLDTGLYWIGANNMGFATNGTKVMDISTTLNMAANIAMGANHITGLAATSMKVGTFTTASGTGNQAVTGVGFKPRVVIFYLALTTGGTATIWALGMMDGNGNQWVDMMTQSTTAASITKNATAAIGITGLSSAAYVSMDADGFTITWASVNAQTCHYLAIE